MGQWIEVVASVVAALVGVAVAAVAAGLGAYAWAVAVIGLSGLGAGVGAYQHISHHRGPWLAILWASTLGLLVMTVLTVFSVGIFLLPGTLAAIVAAITGTWRSGRARAT